jgi:DNA polymerase III subunit chi
MTEVAFHFNAPNQQAYAYRLLRKGYLKGARLVVRTEAHAVQALDAALWTTVVGEFIPHASQGDAPYVLQRSPVQIYSDLPDTLEHAEAAVLVNLCGSMPPGFQRFARVIEVVTFDERDRLQARERWRTYKSHGIEPVRHDLNLEPPG